MSSSISAQRSSRFAMLPSGSGVSTVTVPCVGLSQPTNGILSGPGVSNSTVSGKTSGYPCAPGMDGAPTNVMSQVSAFPVGSWLYIAE